MRRSTACARSSCTTPSGWRVRRLMASQCVQLSPREQDLIVEPRRAGDAHATVELRGGRWYRPDSGARQRRASPIGLGSDGYLNDMFAVMRGAFLIHKARCCDPQVMPAAQVFAMATVGGARALGMEDRDRCAPSRLPGGPAVDRSAHAADSRGCPQPLRPVDLVAVGHHVQRVMVDGSWRVVDGVVTARRHRAGSGAGGGGGGPTVDRRVIEALAAAVQCGEPVVLATVIETDRSVPRHAGSKMLVRADGTTLGSIGGGEMEARVILAAGEALRTKRPQRLHYELVDPRSGDPGVCGGTVELYVEPHLPPHTVFVVGCGHVGRAVVDLAHWLGDRVVAYDDRPEQVDVAALGVCRRTAERFPRGHVGRRTHRPVHGCHRGHAQRAVGSRAAARVARCEPALDRRDGERTPLGGDPRRAGAPRRASSGPRASRVADRPRAPRRDARGDRAQHHVAARGGTPPQCRRRGLTEALAAMLFAEHLVVIRGGGDLATGAALRLHRCGFPVVVCELAHPLTIRRTVAVSSAVRSGVVEIEGMTARLASDTDAAQRIADKGEVAVLIEPTLSQIRRSVVVDARLLKHASDTSISDAPLVVALGPGYTAGSDCHAVVETARGHQLGRVIWDGPATADTGVPGAVGGRSADRVVRAPHSGPITWFVSIGDVVDAEQELGTVGRTVLTAPFAGLVRGLIDPAVAAHAGLKVADVDPRVETNVFEVSDKALAIGGGVVEAVMTWISATH